MVDGRGWGKQEKECQCIVGTKFQLCKTKQVLDRDYGTSCLGGKPSSTGFWLCLKLELVIQAYRASKALV